MSIEMTTDEQLVQMQAHKDNLRDLVKTRDLALRLEKNREFKRLILEEFCEKECARFTRESCNPALSEEQRADSLAMAQAAGHLLRWLSMQVTMGNQAEKQIRDIDDEIAEIRFSV